MQNIQQIITDNFNDNILYIQKEQPALFEKLSALDTAIEKGYYQEKYELVFENDGFDVLEKETDVYLYAKESLAHTLISTNSVNHQVDHNVVEAHVRHEICDNHRLEALEHDTNYFTNYLAHILPITNITNTKKPSDLKELKKFIFFGAGLGLHIEEIAQKIGAEIYFIVEDDLELFKLSLLTCNYKNIAKTSTLVFSVFEEKSEFMNSCSLFLDKHYEYNHYLKFFHLQSHSEYKLHDFEFAVSSQPHIRFQFKNLLLQYTQPFNYIFDNYMFFENSINLQNSEFADLPFLLLASGPSLETNIQWLQKHHNQFITIAVSSSLAFLEEFNIVPNIIIHIDPFEWGIVSFEKLKSLDFIKDSICLFSSTAPKNIVSLVAKDKLFLFETGTNYKDTSLKLSAPCVGSLSYQLLLILNVKNIYLLGLDLCISNDTGKTHAGSHQSQQELKKDVHNETYEPYSYDKSLIDIRGNKSDTVQTTPGFYSSVYTIENFISQFQKDFQTVYNLSDGAKFTNTLPLNTENIDLESKIANNITSKLQQFFQIHSLSSLSHKEFENLEIKLKHALKIKKHLYAMPIKDFTCIEEYIDFLYRHITPTKDLDDYQLTRVLNTYLQYTLSYIYNYFNSDKQIDSVKLFELINLQNTHINQISKIYIDLLQNKYANSKED